MNKYFRNLIALALTVVMLFGVAVPALAASAGTEEYLSELRIIYAESYDEALDILADSEFSDYELFDVNLNEDTGEKGAWLAYKTTTNIDDAITDMSIMQMGGGYKEGNYQQMIKESFDEYVTFGEIYCEAIDYMIGAYDEGYFLAESAFRQLNFYTAGEEFDHERLGDVLYDGVDAGDLATMFMEGNSYALNNIRSLIAMGVGYNEDGKTYLEKVADAAAKMNADPDVFEYDDYIDIAMIIATSLASIRDLMKDLSNHEDNLDYSDEEYTEEEIRYVEAKAVADMLRDVQYLGEQTLYEFIMSYSFDDAEDYSSLYPLAAALNDGQYAMTRVSHYYDVIRYSMSELPEDIIREQLEEAEEKYEDLPFDIYTGVDRSIYDGTFALTTEAYRADAYSEVAILESFIGSTGNIKSMVISAVSFGAGLAIFGYGCHLRYGEIASYQPTLNAAQATYNESVNNAITDALNMTEMSNGVPYADQVDNLFDMYYPDLSREGVYSYADKISYLQKADLDSSNAVEFVRSASQKASEAKSTVDPVSTFAPMSLFTGLVLVVGGSLMVYSCFNLFSTIHSHYNPDYDDIPIAIVDMVETVDGDRYIKYDVVYEAEAREDDKYAPADLNVYEAQRWNALYYTKSYEAGRPLLADEFEVSNTNNKPKNGYTAVHGFGEVICYDLNRYNFDDDFSIYLSVKQSKNDKSAVADVPEIIGSVIGTGSMMLCVAIGGAVGVGSTILAQKVVGKKKQGSVA